MAPRTAVFACALLAAGAQGQWMKDLTNSWVRDADTLTIPQLVAENGGLSAKSCGRKDDALVVHKVDVQPSGLALVVNGQLRRTIRGGTVRAKLNLEKPQGLSISNHFKYVAATAFTRSRTFSESLCKHLGLEEDSKGACHLQPGAHEMKFSFGGLPDMVFVGKYTLEIEVVDEAGQAITCAEGSLTVQAGKSKGLLRKLESGCPSLIAENLDAIMALEIRTCDDDGDASGVRISSFMHDEATWFNIAGKWGTCDTEATGSAPLTVSKRHKDLWKLCSMQMECEFNCSAKCMDDGQGVMKCIPEGETHCMEDREYSGVSRYDVMEQCMNAPAPPGAVSSSFSLLAKVPLLSAVALLLSLLAGSAVGL